MPWKGSYVSKHGFTDATKPSSNERGPRRGPASRHGASPQIELCERRLVLSAQLLVDVMGDQAMQVHGALSGEHDDVLGGTCSPHEAATLDEQFEALETGLAQAGKLPSTVGMPLESHLREAHAATGWNSVQSDYGLTGKGQTVAVIDSGIAWDHMALGEGFGAGYRVVGGWDFTEENDAQPYDDGPFGFHGTHVSGIIGSDDAQHPGVATEVDLVALRVFNDAGQGQMAWVEQALGWVHDNQDTFENPITTVNLSLGTSWNSNSLPGWASLEDELQALHEDGIFVTASAGNSFSEYNQPGLSYPAASPFVLPVASVDDDGSLSDFSQRHQRALAAPGGNIISTVPDHILGSDGTANDFSTASGTSMAAPYVAGASVLVRQAMEMVGIEDIDLDSISSHLRETSDSLFDAATGASYDRLNLANAIDSLIPSDTVGDAVSDATGIDLNEPLHTGWINSLSDSDAYSFTATTAGQLTLSADSQWVDSLTWTLHSGGQIIADSSSAGPLNIAAGTQYEIVVSANSQIGPFDLEVDFEGTSIPPGSGNQPPAPPTGQPVDLGAIDYYSDDLSEGSYQVTAVRDGTMTLQWAGLLTGLDANGELTVSGSASGVDQDASDGMLRVDVQVRAGQTLQFALPSGAAAGELSIANVLAVSGGSGSVTGTASGDLIGLDLSDSSKLSFGNVDYDLNSLGVTSLTVDGGGGADALGMVGSTASDKVDLRPGQSTIENGNLSATFLSTEDVAYVSGGGPDRVYLYDSDGDDTLRASPREADLAGVGYHFNVQDVDRIFIHATGGGQDFAYLYDSAGDDRLSMRPQFASISGDSFFNYVRGFERVYAYATAGGTDEALLYDSAADDRFSTSGETASIVGPGFSSFSRSFESVQAVAEAGGNDRATLYGNDAGVRWQQGSDFISMEDGALQREARGFDNVETFIAGSAHTVGSQSLREPTLGLTQQSVAQPTIAQASMYATAATQEQMAFPDYSAAPDHVRAGGNVEVGPLNADVVQGESLEDMAIEQELLATVRSLSDWVTSADSSHERRTDMFDLPDERVLSDEDFAQSHLDEIFRQFDRNS